MIIILKERELIYYIFNINKINEISLLMQTKGRSCKYKKRMKRRKVRKIIEKKINSILFFWNQRFYWKTLIIWFIYYSF